MKHFREFRVPRARVTPEVAQAFEAILVSLRNLDKAIEAQGNAFLEQNTDIDKERQQLQSELEGLRTIPRKPTAQTTTTPVSTGTPYSSEI